jgi:hypothetical protein
MHGGELIHNGIQKKVKVVIHHHISISGIFVEDLGQRLHYVCETPEIIGVNRLIEGNVKSVHEAPVFPLETEMDPVIVITRFVSAVSYGGLWRIYYKHIRSGLYAFTIYIKPGIGLYQKRQIFIGSQVICHVAGFFMVGIISTGRNGDHDKGPPYKLQNKSVKNHIRI